MESLEKGYHGGVSVFFARRGTISACSSFPEVSFFDIDASFNGCGAIIGEHALMDKCQAFCSYRAMTRYRMHRRSITMTD